MSPPPRRVIFVNRVYWPSGEATAQLLTDLAEALAARGWEVHVIAAGFDATGRNGVIIHRTGPGERHGGLVSRLSNFQRFQAAACRRLATVGRPGDIVVAMTDPPLLHVRLAPVAARGGLKLVCWAQDIYPEIARVHFGAFMEPVAAFLRRRRDATWRGADTCVTLGETMRDTVLAHGVRPESVSVIPNWAPRELDLPPEPAAVAARRRAWGVEGRFVVAYSGNLGRVHEFDTVLDAAARLQAEPDLAFVFIGQGPRFDQVAAIARRRELRQVRLLPPEPREHLAAALGAADVHLVTLQPAYASLVYPSKLAGVLAAGRPALFVGPPAGEIGRLLKEEGCGAAFAPGDAAGLAGTIAQWRGAPDAAARAGRAARLAYERSFTCSAAVERWDRLLTSVC